MASISSLKNTYTPRTLVFSGLGHVQVLKLVSGTCSVSAVLRLHLAGYCWFFTSRRYACVKAVGLAVKPSARCVQDRWLAHQSLVGAAPAYLADVCRLLSDVGRRPLRSNSNDMRKLLVPRTHNKLGDRSFSAAGPRLWNDLPPGLRRPGLTFDSFR